MRSIYLMIMQGHDPIPYERGDETYIYTYSAEDFDTKYQRVVNDPETTITVVMTYEEYIWRLANVH